MSRPLISNIQRFCTHDGPGIRTTVFFKGCPLSCKWCHNPENQRFEKDTVFYEERCVRCGDCGKPGFIPGGCVYGAREEIGKSYTPYALSEILLRDLSFYESSSGGITLSGGEPLAQDIACLTELLRLLKVQGVHTAIDTCGDVPWEAVAAAAPLTDLFLYDMKALDSGLHSAFMGNDNKLILSNLERLSGQAVINLRIPVIGGFNDGREMADMADYAGKHVNACKVNLLPYHNTGAGKYKRLGKTPGENLFYTPSAARMNEIAGLWKAAGFNNVEIGG